MSIISQARKILGARKYRILTSLAHGMRSNDLPHSHCESSAIPLSEDIAALEQWFGVNSISELQIIGRALIEIGAR